MRRFVTCGAPAVAVTVSRKMLVAEGLWEGRPLLMIVDTGASGELRLAPVDFGTDPRVHRIEPQLVIGPLGEPARHEVRQSIGTLALGVFEAQQCLATLDERLSRSLLTLTVIEQLFPGGWRLDARDGIVRGARRQPSAADPPVRRRDGVWELHVSVDGVLRWLVFDTGCEEPVVVFDPSVAPGRREGAVVIGGTSVRTDIAWRNQEGPVGLLGLPVIARFGWNLDSSGVSVTQ